MHDYDVIVRIPIRGADQRFVQGLADDLERRIREAVDDGADLVKVECTGPAEEV